MPENWLRERRLFVHFEFTFKDVNHLQGREPLSNINKGANSADISAQRLEISCWVLNCASKEVCGGQEDTMCVGHRDQQQLTSACGSCATMPLQRTG